MVEWKAESLRAVAASSSRYGWCCLYPWCCELPNPLVTSETQERYRESVFSHFLVPLTSSMPVALRVYGTRCPVLMFPSPQAHHRVITVVFSRGIRRRLGDEALARYVDWAAILSAVSPRALFPLFWLVTTLRHFRADSIRPVLDDASGRRGP
jgi:hypothetical protein